MVGGMTECSEQPIMPLVGETRSPGPSVAHEDQGLPGRIRD